MLQDRSNEKSAWRLGCWPLLFAFTTAACGNDGSEIYAKVASALAGRGGGTNSDTVTGAGTTTGSSTTGASTATGSHTGTTGGAGGTSTIATTGRGGSTTTTGAGGAGVTDPDGAH